MAKTSKKAEKGKEQPTRPGRWLDQVDPAEIDEAIEEACVDAYDEDEQHAGLLTAIEDQLAFPFPARLAGDEVKVVDMEWPDDDPFGLDLIIERAGQRYAIEARSVELIEPLPEGREYLAAYLKWKRAL